MSTEYSDKMDRIISEVNEMVKNEAHYFTNLDDDYVESDKLVINECCLMTKGHFDFLDLEAKNRNRESYEIQISLKHGDHIYNHSFINNGRSLNLINLSKALNDILVITNYTGEKYFCDISLDVDIAGIAFIEFPIEKKIVETANLFRGFGEHDPNEYKYYYEKMSAFNNNK